MRYRIRQQPRLYVIPFILNSWVMAYSSLGLCCTEKSLRKRVKRSDTLLDSIDISKVAFAINVQLTLNDANERESNQSISKINIAVYLLVYDASCHGIL
jgi:hypothetical protein